MREKIARAIVEVLEANGEIVVMDHRLIADAVLDALREPTEKMWRAGSDSIDGLQRLERGHAYAIEAQHTWRAMIDATK